jgi:predicted DNA-binding ribbon-helix-helix protein
VTGSQLVTRNVIAGHGRRTSMRLEPEFWDALHEICQRERQDLSELVRGIESINHTDGRTSAVRVFVVEYFRAATAEVGQAIGRGRPQQPPRHGGPQVAAKDPFQVKPPLPRGLREWPAERLRRLAELWDDPTRTISAIARELGVQRSTVILERRI